MFQILRALALVWYFALTYSLSVDGSIWENESYLRSIDLTRSYVRESCVVEAKNLDSKPQNIYMFTINNGDGLIEDVSLISGTLEDSPLSIQIQKSEHGVYELKFPAPIAPGSHVNFKVSYAYIDSIEPFPKKLDMEETQNVLFKFNKLPYSPYTTNTYSLSVTGTESVKEITLDENERSKYTDSKSTLSMKVNVEKNSISYGPLLSKVAPYAVDPIGISYEFNKPLLSVTRLERSLWIPSSDIADIAIEEEYDITNKAAALNKGFSRLDWMKGRYETIPHHWALSRLIFNIYDKSDFKDYYYSDLVGVVSTHKRISNNLILNPRFPLFGGWKYNFTLGWYDKLSKYIHTEEGSNINIVRFPLLNSLRYSTYENVTVNFFLPENAKFIGVSSPVSYDTMEVSNELSYFDVYEGHRKVTLKFRNLFDDMGRLDIYLKYEYTPANHLQKLLKITGFFFCTLLLFRILL